MTVTFDFFVIPSSCIDGYVISSEQIKDPNNLIKIDHVVTLSGRTITINTSDLSLEGPAKIKISPVWNGSPLTEYTAEYDLNLLYSFTEICPYHMNFLIDGPLKEFFFLKHIHAPFYSLEYSST